jgi:hypothetical protein
MVALNPNLFMTWRRLFAVIPPVVATEQIGVISITGRLIKATRHITCRLRESFRDPKGEKDYFDIKDAKIESY